MYKYKKLISIILSILFVLANIIIFIKVPVKQSVIIETIEEETTIPQIETIELPIVETRLALVKLEKPTEKETEESTIIEETETAEEETEIEIIETEPIQTGAVVVDLRSANQRLVQSATPAERDMLARIARAECGGESVQSMACIICIILNRVQSPNFPNTIQGVIESPGQFTPVRTGEYYVAATPVAWQALQLVEQGYDPSCGATYFSSGRSQWHWNKLHYLGTFERIYMYHE